MTVYGLEQLSNKIAELQHEINELKKHTPLKKKVLKELTCFIPLSELESLEEAIADEEGTIILTSHVYDQVHEDVKVTITYETEE